MGVTRTIFENSKPYEELKRTIAQLNSSFVKVGFPEGAPTGKANKSKKDAKPYADMSEIARVAAWNEFGVEYKEAVAARAKRGFMAAWKIPPRPFFRNAVDGWKEKIGAIIEKTMDNVLIGKLTPAEGFDVLGNFGKREIQLSIKRTLTPPNAPLTIEKKESSHPLIDSGQLLNSVTFLTVKK